MSKNKRKNKKSQFATQGIDLFKNNLTENVRGYSIAKKDGQEKKALDGSDLFSLFTANIIKEEVVFTR